MDKDLCMAIQDVVTLISSTLSCFTITSECDTAASLSFNGVVFTTCFKSCQHHLLRLQTNGRHRFSVADPKRSGVDIEPVYRAVAARWLKLCYMSCLA